MPLLEKDLWTGIFHCHTHFSKDAWMSPEEILDHALSQHLDFVIVTDHNSIKGSVALKKLVEKKGLPLQVPIAAEYFTEYGDVIAMFIQDHIEFTSIQDLAEKVAAQGGLLALPHPYVSHKQLEKILPYVQFVEVFNGRTLPQLNADAEILCDSHGLRSIYGSDAHIRKNLKDVVIQVPRQQDLKQSFLKGPIIPMRLRLATKGDYLCSRWIYTLKAQHKQIPHLFLRSVWNIVNGSWFKPIGS